MGRVLFGSAGVAGLTAVSVPVDAACWSAKAVGRGLCWVSGRLRAARARLAANVGTAANELAEQIGDAAYGPAGPAPMPATAAVTADWPAVVTVDGEEIDVDQPIPFSLADHGGRRTDPGREPTPEPVPEPVTLPMPEPEPMPAAAQTTEPKPRKPAKRIDRTAAFELAAALIDKGSSRRAAATAAGVSESTLRTWLSRRTAAVK